ncbi:programmed cell death protein 1 [Rhinophrynus dorsalis]
MKKKKRVVTDDRVRKTTLDIRIPEGCMLFTHSPSAHVLALGRTAVFICNISSLNYNPGDINWSMTHNNNSNKIADSKSSTNNRSRIYIKTDWTSRTAELHITNLMVEDSGEYHCEHVNVTAQNTKIIVSNKSWLNVTAFHMMATSMTELTTPLKQREENKPAKFIIISASIVLSLLLLLCSALLLVWHKKRNKTPQDQLKHLEKPSQDSVVYTVDYGVLEFQSNQQYRKSAALCTLEQVEYATIMFPQGTPSMGECRGRDSECNYIAGGFRD